MKAPAERIYPLIIDLHRWGAWSPWEHLDPAMVKTCAGPERGVGASYRWVGNKKAGEGTTTITDATPNVSVTLDLEVSRPWQARNQVGYALQPVDGGTEVTWTMMGRSKLGMKAFGMLMDLDALVGRDFDKGLVALETAAQPVD